jgi:Domain of unknown function (DUF222)
MFESAGLSATSESAALLEQACTAARSEAQATARRLNAIADLMGLRSRQYGDRAEWVADLWDAIAAELAAALRVSRALASSYMSDAEILRDRLPKVGECLAAGDINYAMFGVIAYRTALITDPKALAAVDAQVALRAPRWPSLTRGNLAMRVDAIVADVDRDAIRRTNKEVKTVTLRSPLTNLAICLDRLGHYAAAASIAGFALSPLTATSFPKIDRTIAHLREVLGDQTYESLARKGETMTTSAMASYAYDQIDQARTELEHPS